MRIIPATVDHLSLLAEMNLQLIEDEGHRNSMSVDQLKNRMAVWINSEYSAALFQENTQNIGYVLWREADNVISLL